MTTPPPATPTDEPMMSDEQIRSWIRACPESWDVATAERAELDDAVLRRVLGGEVRAGLVRGRRRARFGATLVIGLFGAGTAVGVAALVRSGQPSVPEAGIVCRADASLEADAVVVVPADDPIAACADAWKAGRLTPTSDVPATDTSGVPALVACIGTGGAVEVFPGDETTCGLLGLEPAAPSLDDEARAVVALQERIAAEVHATCVSGDEIRVLLEQMLAEAALSGWTIQLTDDAPGAACVRVAVDGAARSLVVAAVT